MLEQQEALAAGFGGSIPLATRSSLSKWRGCWEELPRPQQTGGGGATLVARVVFQK